MFHCGEQLNCSLLNGNSKCFYCTYENCCQRHYILFIKKRPTNIWKLSKAEKVRPQPNISTLNLAFFFSGKSTGDENKNMISDFVIFTKLN